MGNTTQPVIYGNSEWVVLDFHTTNPDENLTFYKCYFKAKFVVKIPSAEAYKTLDEASLRNIAPQKGKTEVKEKLPINNPTTIKSSPFLFVAYFESFTLRPVNAIGVSAKEIYHGNHRVEL